MKGFDFIGNLFRQLREFLRASEKGLEKVTDTPAHLSLLGDLMLKSIEEPFALSFLELMYINDGKKGVRTKGANGQFEILGISFAKAKELLPNNFIQCHKSYIVNSNYIKKINKKTLTLIDEERIPYQIPYNNK